MQKKKRLVRRSALDYSPKTLYPIVAPFGRVDNYITANCSFLPINNGERQNKRHYKPGTKTEPNLDEYIVVRIIR